MIIMHTCLCKIPWRKYYFLLLYYTHSIDPKEDVERDKRKRLKGQYIEL